MIVVTVTFNTVLIESDWNLKDMYELTKGDTDKVLIESDWNLKQI